MTTIGVLVSCALLATFCVHFSLAQMQPVSPNYDYPGQYIAPIAKLTMQFNITTDGKVRVQTEANGYSIFDSGSFPLCSYVTQLGTVIPEIKTSPLEDLCQVITTGDSDGLWAYMMVTTNINRKVDEVVRHSRRNYGYY